MVAIDAPVPQGNALTDSVTQSYGQTGATSGHRWQRRSREVTYYRTNRLRYNTSVSFTRHEQVVN